MPFKTESWQMSKIPVILVISSMFFFVVVVCFVF